MWGASPGEFRSERAFWPCIGLVHTRRIARTGEPLITDPRAESPCREMGRQRRRNDLIIRYVAWRSGRPSGKVRLIGPADYEYGDGLEMHRCGFR